MSQEMTKQHRVYKLVIKTSISVAYEAGDQLEIETLSCLRHLPKRRSVWQASHQGQHILLKIYDPHPKQARDVAREWANATKIFQAGLSIAAPLFMATSSDGLVAVAYKFISNGMTLAEHLALTDEAGKKDGIRQLLEMHAIQHKAGCYQQDDHLENYLWSDGKLFMLDAGSCVMKSGPLGLEDRVNNMALLTANMALPDRKIYDEEFARYLDLCPESVSRQGFMEAYGRAFPKAVAKRLQDYCRKTRRSSSKLERINLPGKRWHACVDINQDVKEQLLDDPDRFFDEGTLLKNGNTCTVVGLDIAGEEYVLKRYNKKSLCYRLLHAFMPVRALRSWTAGHALRMFGIQTPRPLACLVFKRGPITNQAYLLMEKVSGRPLHKLNDPEIIAMADRVTGILEQLAELKVSHGDLKASNMIRNDEGKLALIDLDSLCFHRSGMAFEREHSKDKVRLLRNWDDSPQVQAALKKGLNPD